MAKLNLKYYGEPVLREKARPIEVIDGRFEDIARDMAETMYGARGIGLAANQVGLTERIILVDVDWADDVEGRGRRPLALINPEVLAESEEDDTLSEGCLSLPGIEGEVWRPVRIRYRYRDLAGQSHEDEAEGLKARCILHEIDHLNGVLFIDRMAVADRVRLAGKLNLLRKKTETLG